jgi:hypothetical protein
MWGQTWLLPHPRPLILRMPPPQGITLHIIAGIWIMEYMFSGCVKKINALDCRKSILLAFSDVLTASFPL